jgi:hypothetical protein
VGVNADRLKGGFAALARDPLALYSNLYRAKVVRQLGNLRRVDVVPTDPRLPPMSNIPLLVGVPGMEARILPGHFVLVGWENGHPDKPFATLWAPGESGTKPVQATIHASALELGGKAVEPVIKGGTYVAAEKAWFVAFTAWAAAVAAAIAADAGVAPPLKATLAAAQAALVTATTTFGTAPVLSAVVRTQ